MSFQGKVAWITGASSGIGEALAHALSRGGARLILSSRRPGPLEEVRRALPYPGDHLIVPLDLADPPSLTAAAERALAHSERVDLLLNNGGVSQRSLAKDTDLAVDRRILEVNYLGTVALTKAVLPSMLQQRSGHIVVITSLVGKIGTPLRSSYAASKHALHGFFDSLRAEVWGQGIYVTLVCPGFVRTQVSVNALTGDGTPQGKMDRAQEEGMSPERCAAAILRAVERRRDEVLIGGKETLAVHLKRFFPGLFNRFIRNARVT